MITDYSKAFLDITKSSNVRFLIYKCPYFKMDGRTSKLPKKNYSHNFYRWSK